MAFTVTAVEHGTIAAGMAIVLKVLTGAAVLQPGAVNSAASATPNLSITPNNNNSLIYGSVLGLTGTYTANGSTTSSQNVTGSGLRYLQCRSTSMTTAGVAQTIGYTGATSISMCLCEINAAGTLVEDASSPAPTGYVGLTTETTASFSPPPGSLLVLMVATNGGSGVVSLTVSDTSGLGLIWAQQVSQAGIGNGYSGIWTARVPGGYSGAFFPFFNS
jgi:hypothetical protein